MCELFRHCSSPEELAACRRLELERQHARAVASFNRTIREHTPFLSIWQSDPATLPVFTHCWAERDPLDRLTWQHQLRRLAAQCDYQIAKKGRSFHPWASDFRRTFEVRLLTSFADLHRHPDDLATFIAQLTATNEVNPLLPFAPTRMRDVRLHYHSDHQPRPPTRAPAVPHLPLLEAA